jgi:transmembrane sensor
MKPVVDGPAPDAIQTEAMAWVIRLDGGQLPPEDRAALAEWARRTPAHAAALREMARAWGQLDALTALKPAEIAPAPRRAAAHDTRTVRPARRRAYAAAAAAILLSVGAYGYFRVSPGVAIDEVHVTSVGEQRVVTLADGSEIHLNTATEIEVDFEREARRIRLVHGEALFEVAPDSDRPFIVFSDVGAVRAVGTVFAVRADEERLDVTVSEGLVDLIPDAKFAGRVGEPVSRLARNQAAARAAGEEFTVRDLDARELERVLAWNEGVLVFDGQTLSQAVEEFGRYTALRFDIADQELADLRVGGRFRVGEVEQFLDALESTFGLQVIRQGERVTLSLAQG